ncbi:hypothetical protein MPSEU_000207300 [Mayamaea pseudoterrestris]|nr:hypothetical protein MPSEU_000207300 [Mayamaea pseudoterrestris]
MVTWGTNTVHKLDTAPAMNNYNSPAAATGAAPAGNAFINATPAPSALNGSTNPAPAGSAGGSSFGTTPAGSTLFGGGLTATTGGLFGSAPASTSGSNLFGSAPTSAPGGLFGQNAFGANNQQPQQQFTQLPAHAAMQAHLEASARQEEARVIQKFDRIQRSYTGAEVANDDESAKFAAILYNPVTREVSQQQWLQGIALDGRPRPIALPRPAQFSEHDWNQALVRNPDFLNYMPIPIVGAEALQARLTYQQNLSNQCNSQLDTIAASQDTLRRRGRETQQRLEYMQRKHEMLKVKFLKVMKKVELARCLNLPLQRDEVEATRQIALSLQQVHELYQATKNLTETLQLAPPGGSGGGQMVVQVPNNQRNFSEQLFPMVKGHRAKLIELYGAVKQDVHDLKLIQKRVDQLNATRTLR